MMRIFLFCLEFCLKLAVCSLNSRFPLKYFLCSGWRDLVQIKQVYFPFLIKLFWGLEKCCWLKCFSVGNNCWKMSLALLKANDLIPWIWSVSGMNFLNFFQFLFDCDCWEAQCDWLSVKWEAHGLEDWTWYFPNENFRFLSPMPMKVRGTFLVARCEWQMTEGSQRCHWRWTEFIRWDYSLMCSESLWLTCRKTLLIKSLRQRDGLWFWC